MPKPNWGSAAGGAASGAAAGSLFGPAGTAIGGLVGGIGGLFGGGSSKPKVKKLSTMTDTQKELEALISEALTQGTGPLAGLFGNFNEEQFNKGVTEPMLKNFQEKILPILNEKFIENNQYNSTGRIKANQQAGVDLQAELAKLLYEAQQGHKQNQLSGLNTIYGKQGIENIYQKPEQSPISGLIQGIGSGVGSAAGKNIAG